MTDTEKRAIKIIMKKVCAHRSERYIEDSHSEMEDYCRGLPDYPKCEYQCIDMAIAAAAEVENDDKRLM